MAQEKEEKLQRILWLDTETTGLDHGVLRVLEVGWTVTDLELNTDSTFAGGGIRALVLGSGPRGDVFPDEPLHARDRLAGMDDFVRDMHTKNGLLLACAESPFTERNAEKAIISSMQYVESHYDIPVQWVLGGAGVSTFDMRVLQKWFPSLHSRLAYWTYDVSVVRRYMRDIFGIPETPEFKSDSHRVKEDVSLALAEARHFRGMMSELTEARLAWTEAAAWFASIRRTQRLHRSNADYWKRRYEVIAGPVDDDGPNMEGVQEYPARVIEVEGDPTAEDLAFYDKGNPA